MNDQKAGKGAAIHHILVVDDEENVRLLLQELLTSMEYLVRVAEDGRQAREALAGEPVDLVLTDVRMPGMDGVELMQWIREFCPGTDVIVMTGYASVESALDSIRLGAADYLLKPFPDLKVVASAVERVMRKRRLELELQQTTDMLQVSQQSFASIVERATDGILVTDKGGRVLYANGAAEQLLGRTRETLLNLPLGIKVQPGEMQEIKINLPSDMRGIAEIRVDETEWQGSDALLVLVRDISERKRMQAQIAQNDRLASMGLLAAGVAHEINNPLTYIMYNVESLARQVPKVAQHLRSCHLALTERLGSEAAAELLGGTQAILDPEQLGEMVSWSNDALIGARRVRDIVRGLKTFSHMHTDDRAPVQLNAAIEHAISMAYNEIKYRARLVKELGAIPEVVANDGRLSQVFLNLLLNAAQAIEEGDAERQEIKVRTWATGGEAFAEVSDTGKGIPLENLKDIFEPFFTTKEVGVGSGMGLSICQSIVTSYGGSITAESSPEERRTRFVIRLPIASAQDLQPPSQRAGLTASETPSIRGRILVVDDDPIVGSTLRRVLAADHDVEVVSSGAAGQRLLEQDGGFDLILCDLMMPDITGMDLHRWLETQSPALASRMVFMTGGVFTIKASEFLRRVPNLAIEKPFEIRNLKTLVGHQVARVKGG